MRQYPILLMPLKFTLIVLGTSDVPSTRKEIRAQKTNNRFSKTNILLKDKEHSKLLIFVNVYIR